MKDRMLFFLFLSSDPLVTRFELMLIRFLRMAVALQTLTLVL